MVGRLEAVAHLERLRQTLEVIREQELQKALSRAWGPYLRRGSAGGRSASSEGDPSTRCCTAAVTNLRGPPATQQRTWLQRSP